MKRLLVHVEGQTEENFVNEILGPHLQHHGYSLASARLMGNARRRHERGGIRGWPEAKRGIVRHLREDTNSVSTTMVDYYGLPQHGNKKWPGRAAANRAPFAKKTAIVEDAIHRNLTLELGSDFQPSRFLPYVMMHEFEAMLFSDCTLFAEGIGRPKLELKFQNIADTYGEPEKIDDTPAGAPSKRIERLVNNYEKPIMGILAILEIGLEKIRTACPHFNDWLTQLEQLPETLR